MTSRYHLRNLLCLLMIVTFAAVGMCGPEVLAEEGNSYALEPYLEYEGLPETVRVGDTGTVSFRWPEIAGVQTEEAVSIYPASRRPQKVSDLLNVRFDDMPESETPVLDIRDDLSWEALSPGVFTFTQSYTFSEETLEKLKSAGVEDLVKPAVSAVHHVIVVGERCGVERFYNPYTGEHLYTMDDAEKAALSAAGWKDEDVAWTAPGLYESTAYICRLYNPYSDEHLYTTDPVEREVLSKNGWQDEGEKIPVDPNGTVPVYRLFNPNAKTNTHLFTTDLYEKEVLTKQGWEYEGIAWCGCE